MSFPRYLISTQSYKHEYATGEEIPTQFGYLLEMDFHGFERRLSIPTPTANPNDERIKTGLRGISVYEGIIYVASWNAVHRIQAATFSYLDSFSHPLMADLHGIHVDSQGIYVSSSLIDALLAFDFEHNLKQVFQLSQTSLYPSAIRGSVDLSQDYRLRGKEFAGFRSFHANHVTAYDDKYLLLTGRGDKVNNGRVLKVARDLSDFKIWMKGLLGPHDGLWLSGGAFATTETEGSSIAVIDPNGLLGPRLRSRLKLPRTEEKYWTRGLAEGPDSTLLVGRSVWKGDVRDASVIQIDRSGNQLAQFALKIPDYPECRIFQIARSN
jgi:hypothetical protein